MAKGSFNVGMITTMIVGVLMSVIFLVVGINLAPTVIYYFGFINATSMASVQLGTIIVLFASYGSLFFMLAIIGGGIAKLVQSSK